MLTQVGEPQDHEVRQVDRGPIADPGTKPRPQDATYQVLTKFRPIARFIDGTDRVNSSICGSLGVLSML